MNDAATLSLLMSLAECADARKANLVFLSSEGNMPATLRSMSGWGAAVRDYTLEPIEDKDMREYLVSTWGLAAKTADRIVAQVGCGVRDVFLSVLEDYLPGDTVRDDIVDTNIRAVIEPAKDTLLYAMNSLANADRIESTGKDDYQRGCCCSTIS